MAEELEELCRRMHLSDHEKTHSRLRRETVAESKRETQFSILFKLLTTRQFNGEALKGTIRNLWAAAGGIIIRDIEDNLFMAVFTRREDMDRVFVQSPWTFDKKLIQIVRFDGDLQPAEISFKYSAFWIRVFNLPIKSMVRQVGEDIGNAIGRSIEVDVPENGFGWGRYLRIRVNIDITQPLLRGKIFEFEQGTPFWVDFRYEHLPIFCYRCGMIGHSVNECVVGRGSGGDGGAIGDKFGPWLRAVATRGNYSRRPPRESSPSAEDQGTNHSTRRREESSASIVRLVVQDTMGDDVGVGVDRAADEVSSPERIMETPISQLRVEVGETVVGEQVGDKLTQLEKEMEVNPEVVPNIMGSNIQNVDNYTMGLKDTCDPFLAEIMQTEILGTTPVEHVPHKVSEVAALKATNLHGPYDDTLHGMEPRGGVGLKTKWKKRARIQQDHSFAMPLTTSVGVSSRGKRSLHAEDETDYNTDEEPRRKKQIISGVTGLDNSVSAEAAWQLRRSQ